MSMSVSFREKANSTSIRHNNRGGMLAYADNIDTERTPNNIVFVMKDIDIVYDEVFSEGLKKYNAKQKRKDRKIENYRKHLQNSDKHEHQREMIVQVGDMFNFEDKQGENWNNAVSILTEYMQSFQTRNPNLKVYNAVMHLDEESPHLHINFIPFYQHHKEEENELVDHVKKDGTIKRKKDGTACKKWKYDGLEKQVSMEKALNNQGYNGPKCFEGWRTTETQYLEELLKEEGIERHKVGTHDYLAPRRYRETMKEAENAVLRASKVDDEVRQALELKNSLERQNKSLKLEIEEKEKLLQRLEKKIKELYEYCNDTFKRLKKEWKFWKVTAERGIEEHKTKTMEQKIKKFDEELEQLVPEEISLSSIAEQHGLEVVSKSERKKEKELVY